jgi:hypothetical protein
MKTLSSVALALLLLSAGAVRAETEMLADQTQLVQPPTPAPSEAPPAAPQVVPPPPQQSGLDGAVNQAQLAPPTAGQWVYTSQYGWVWMPYGAQYSYAPAVAGAAPYAYAYYPAFGWRWLGAPWVGGWGPRPYFGPYGAARFGWYHQGYVSHPVYGYRPGFGYRPPPAYHPVGHAYVAAPRGAFRAGVSAHLGRR